MEITDIAVTKASTESWGEFVEFLLVTVMSKYDEYNNAEGDNPQARRKWMGPIGDVVEDPQEGERLWDVMYRATIPFARTWAVVRPSLNYDRSAVI